MLHFQTDCWTAPNRRAYMAVMVQYAKDGVVNEWLLDIVEVGRRHTGVVLAEEFEHILDKFGIKDKVSMSHWRNQRAVLNVLSGYGYDLR